MLEVTEDRLREIVENFHDWVSCGCSECRCDGNAHAIDHDDSKMKLFEYILKELQMNPEYQCEVTKDGMKLKDLPPMTLFTSFNKQYLKLGDFSEVYEQFKTDYKPTAVVDIYTGRVVFHNDESIVTPHKSKLHW